jgi:hypothetical protein
MQALTYSGSDCVNPIDTAGLLREANELAAQLKAQLDAQQHAHMLGAALASWAKRYSLRQTKLSRGTIALTASDIGAPQLRCE